MKNTKYHMDIVGTCMVCGEPGTRILNLRMRRPDTGAVFGRNIRGAVFCPIHADFGADIEITFKPNRTGDITYTVVSGDRTVTYASGMTNGNPDQESLI